MKSGDRKRPVTEPSINEWNGPRRKRAGGDLVYTLRYPVTISPPSSPFSYRSAAFPTPGFHGHGTPVGGGPLAVTDSDLDRRTRRSSRLTEKGSSSHRSQSRSCTLSLDPLSVFLWSCK